MSDDLNAPCPHGRTRVDCPHCLDGFIEEELALAEIEEASEGDATCPECRAGKHRNCDGQAWDDAADAPTACACEHAEVTP